MSKASLDLSWITEDLAIGGWFCPTTCHLLTSEYGVSHVVDMRAESCDDGEILRTHGIFLLRLPTRDLCAVSQEMLWEGVNWCQDARESGKRILIHCQHGIGRSATLACCVLVSRGYSPIKALKLAKSARQRVSPSPEQLHAYLSWAADWCLKNNKKPFEETWDALARIAYRGGATE